MAFAQPTPRPSMCFTYTTSSQVSTTYHQCHITALDLEK
jgi:hypothetical protein